MRKKRQWYQKIEPRFFLIGGCTLLGIIVVSFFCVSLKLKSDPDKLQGRDSQIIEMTESSSELTQSSSDSLIMMVDVKGAVITPGIYEVTDTMRVYDAIQLAGGFTSQADQNKINLAQLLADQQVLYIPIVGEKMEEVVILNNGVSGELEGNQGEEKININLADGPMLQTLNGIGEKKAEAIIQYREENGSFQKIEEIKKVKGIGEKTFESLRESITIN